MSADYIPAAVANATAGAIRGFLMCPECGAEVGTTYGTMGSGEPLRCGRCFDDWAFRNAAPGVREAAEARRDAVLGFTRPFAAKALAELAPTTAEAPSGPEPTPRDSP